MGCCSSNKYPKTRCSKLNTVYIKIRKTSLLKKILKSIDPIPYHGSNIIS